MKDGLESSASSFDQRRKAYCFSIVIDCWARVASAELSVPASAAWEAPARTDSRGSRTLLLATWNVRTPGTRRSVTFGASA